ncbi:MAG: flagellar hook-basal body complex protein FliE [Campylobacterota bacterium]|nr:flagellar hook-basal body complex protein FliE [Campylobacterota bacterium]
MKLIEITNSLSGLDNNSISDLNSNKEQQFIDLNNKNDSSFSTILKNSIDEVNDTQLNAYNAMEEIATGKVENLQEAIQRIEEAELSLKLGLEVKNKALGAYKQIMAMQV